ncbi:hypothetical protein MtrunA17_Chr7g0242011 [Medicago truncatula]|uniref:DUF247 domain protein n=1 Tax=Medicago truncatula TaxID=3880 RepID=G7KRC7_MEDTR|nr:UPF0481 protein At3g47200 [Medicago truncatula]AES79469.1 DUF247 domain protein [Medicago truncatula]RHN46420.1 hypothetical protein MtrunA17_Chr7g0242011 [Medicago truncatula]
MAKNQQRIGEQTQATPNNQSRSGAQTHATSSNQTTETDTDMNKWLVSTMTLLKSLDNGYIQSCSIPIVPEELKNSTNKEAYMPRVVTIGPRFKGSREDLLLMEEVKLRCLFYLFHRSDGDVKQFLLSCSEAIWKADEKIRASYVYMPDIKLSQQKLANIMLIDGCFLLELLIAKGMDSELRCQSSPPSPALKVLKDEDVLSDILLLENQIPIIVLHILSEILFPTKFKTADPKERIKKINNLFLSITGYSHSQVQDPNYFNSPHVIDIVHVFVNREGERKSHVVGNYVVPIDSTQHLKPKLMRCASRLQAAGVTIKLAEETANGNCCFNFLWKCFGGICIKLHNMLVTNNQVDALEEVKGMDFYFNFEKGTLEIAQLEITKTTKAKWCNVIAWEHHKNNWKCSTVVSGINGNNQINTTHLSRNFTASALIFDGLICCAADVKLLKDKNIIVDHLKMSNEELEEFLHSMSFGVDLGIVDSSYVKIVDDLNDYSHSFFVLRNLKIFSHLFKGRLEWLFKFLKQNYNFVAAMLAFLTLVQTVYTVLSYHLPK